MKVAVGTNESKDSLFLDKEYLRFLRQIGVTHTVCHLPGEMMLPSTVDGYWSEEDLKALVKHFNENGLQLEAIENFQPAHWYKIVMDLSGKEKQLENIKRIIQNMGKAKIPIMGYNFSGGGCFGRLPCPSGRGGAIGVSYDPIALPYEDSRVPKSTLWNRVVEPEAEGEYEDVSREEMKQRLYWFLEQILPVCADANVMLAAHPEDPPMPYQRHIGRVLISPQDYDEMFEKFQTPYCGVEFCQGTFAEMGVDVYKTIEHFASQKRIGYVHLRNVKGVVPSYAEVMIDEGDTDMAKAIKTYHEAGFDGAFIPDHYPVLASEQGKHAAVAYPVAYMRGLMKALNIPIWGE